MRLPVILNVTCAIAGAICGIASSPARSHLSLDLMKAMLTLSGRHAGNPKLVEIASDHALLQR
jgi:hypothetical protein